MDFRPGTLRVVSVVRSRGRQLLVDRGDAGSATRAELRTLPVGGVVALLVEDEAVAIKQGVLRTLVSSGDEL